MISSVDTYVYEQFKQRFEAILKDEYIVDNALARLDKEARENFKRAFVGENPSRKVEVTYAFPGVKEKFDARVVVQMGSGNVISESIGNVQGTFTYRELGKHVETTYIEDAGNGELKIPLEHEIGELVAVEELSFSASDNVREEGKNIFFRKSGNESLIYKDEKEELEYITGEKQGELKVNKELPLTIHYIAREVPEGDKPDPKGVKVGFTSREAVTVTPLSTSMDTARCLDALIKVILIIMLENKEEKDEYLLQGHKFEEMQNIIPEPLDRLVFGRPLVLSYDVSNNLDFDYINEVTEINLKY